jgi:hypothetical protein
MKPKRTSEELDSLLGRGGIGVSRKEAILQTVLAKCKADPPARRLWRWPIAGLALAAVVGATAIVMAPLPSQTPAVPFRAKGATAKQSPMAPLAELECLGGPLGACPMGSLLVVRVTGTHGYVSAWAEPVGGGERIWYFSGDSQPLAVAADSAHAVAATRAVKIGPEHTKSAYLVEIRVTDRPMPRSQLLGLPAPMARAAGRVSLTVTPP